MKKRWFKKRPTERLDVDEIFYDSHQLKGKSLRWEDRVVNRVSLSPMKWLWVGALLVLTFFLARTFWLNIVSGEEFKNLSRQNHVREIWQRSSRGIIYSSNLTPLLENVSLFNLVLIPAELPRERQEQEVIIDYLKTVFNEERDDIKELFEDIDRFSSRPVPLFTNLERPELLKLQNKIDTLPGLALEENFRRRYSQSENLSHILGYTGVVSKEDIKQNSDYLLTDLVGKVGLEAEYEDILRGKYGKTEIETSSFGSEERTLFTTKPEAGKNIVLFLNLGLQKKLTQEMSRAMSLVGVKRGAALAIDPRSGGVLALQSFPLYDNNVFSSRSSDEDIERLFSSSNQPLFNRVISGLYPPGSTIKPFIASAGVEEKVVDENTTVNVTGSITVAGQEFRDWRAHGVVDLKRAIAVSSNVYFYSLGGGYGEIDGLGPYLIKRYLSLFGFDSLLGIDLPGEKKGFLPDPNWKKDVKKEKWFIGDTYNISIGQGDALVTPLSLAVGTAAIANGGTLLRPRLVRGITDAQLKNIELTEAEVLESDIVSSESLNLVREGMREAVIDGSARLLQAIPASSAGKTGTAQAGTNKDSHAWFTVFAPYKNPEIALVILIENGGEGSSVAAPVAQSVLSWYFTQ